MAEQSERELMIDFLKVELEYYQAQLPYRDKVRQLREKMLAAWQGQTHPFAMKQRSRLRQQLSESRKEQDDLEAKITKLKEELEPLLRGEPIGGGKTIQQITDESTQELQRIHGEMKKILDAGPPSWREIDEELN